MRKILLTIASVLFCVITFAQNVPQGINYQAVARDANGDVLMNQALTIQFSVISDITTIPPTISWQETQTVSTNDYGLYTAIIGGGTATNVGSSASFDVIDWGASNHLLKVEVDFGSGYLDMGTTAFMSVPYSMNASNVDPTDELQSLSISGDTLFISSGNYIVLPSSAPTLLGCTDPTAFNYDASANTDDGSCIAVVNGCTDSTAYSGYNPLANTDDGSCVAVALGCTDSTSWYYDPLANTDDGSCQPNGTPCDDGDDCTIGDVWQNGACVGGYPLICDDGDPMTMDVCDGAAGGCIFYGCTDSLAFNFNPTATSDNGSCIAVVLGCTDSTAYSGYNPLANTDDGSCIAVVYGCTDSTAYSGYNPLANTDDGSCIAIVNGCTDATAFNYNPSANTDDGSCYPIIFGCTDSTAYSGYNPLANTDDGSCITVVYGCMDSTMFNYSASANTDDGSCIAVVYGCTDSTAFNYDPSANTDDGSCASAIGDNYQGGIIFYLDGNGGGLLAAPTDQSSGEWGCYGTAIPGADGTAIGTGNQNTIDIEAGCITPGTAADICANLTLGGYSDWFLPSKHELNAMQLNIGQGNALGLGNIGGFASSYYWSSSEVSYSQWPSSNYAWMQHFNSGVQYWNYLKDYFYSVRAVRAF